MVKTNSMRILDSAKIKYEAMEYEYDENDLAGVHIAENLGLDPDIVFKTLVARGDKTPYVVFCIPCAYELDLKKCAKASGNKRGAYCRKGASSPNRLHKRRLLAHRHEKAVSHIF